MDAELRQSIQAVFQEAIESSAPFCHQLRVKVYHGTGNDPRNIFTGGATDTPVTWALQSTTTYQADIGMSSDPSYQYDGVRDGESRLRAIISAALEGVSVDALVTNLTRASGTDTLVRHELEVGSGTDMSLARVLQIQPSVIDRTVTVDLAVANRTV